MSRFVDKNLGNVLSEKFVFFREHLEMSFNVGSVCNRFLLFKSFLFGCMSNIHTTTTPSRQIAFPKPGGITQGVNV